MESDWKKIVRIIFRRGIPLRVRGYSALFLAKELKEKYYDSLSEEERKVVDEVLS